MLTSVSSVSLKRPTTIIVTMVVFVDSEVVVIDSVVVVVDSSVVIVD